MAKLHSVHYTVYARLRDFYAHFVKNRLFIRATKISHYTLTASVAFQKKSYVEGDIHGSGFDRTAYLDRQLFPHLTQLLLRPSLVSPAHSNAQRFNGPPRSKTPGKIIQISSLRFPSNLGERGGSTHNTRAAPGTRVPTDVSQSESDYKAAITDRTAGRSAENGGKSAPKDGRDSSR